MAKYSSIRKTYMFEHVTGADFDYFYLRSADGTLLEFSNDIKDLFETVSVTLAL